MMAVKINPVRIRASIIAGKKPKARFHLDENQAEGIRR